MTEFITIKDQIDHLTAKHGNREAVAKLLGIDKGGLSKMYNGKMFPTNKKGAETLKKLGLQHHHFYTSITDGRRTKTA